MTTVPPTSGAQCRPGDVVVASRRSSLAAVARKYPGCDIVDVTSKAEEPWKQFSPFFPHGNIPIPFSAPEVGASVEGIWQGLKVFEREDVDPSKFSLMTMKNLKRSSRRLGPVLGHRKGVHGRELLPYAEARADIYIPTFRWVLANHLEPLLARLRSMALSRGLVLLDYETNIDPLDLRRPLSHAGLVREQLLREMSLP